MVPITWTRTTENSLHSTIFPGLATKPDKDFGIARNR
jgi:hypothetical protein